MKINLDTPGDDVQVQIVPLIDVIFCILTFFILAVLQFQRPQGINLNLPQSKSSTVQPPERLIVTLAQTGQLYVGQQEVDRTQLESTLKAYQEKNPTGLLVLNAPQNAFYSDIIQVLDVLRSVGGDRVALATVPAVPTQNPTLPGMLPGTTPGMTAPGAMPEAMPGTMPGLTTPGTTPGSAPGMTVPGTMPGNLFDPNFAPSGLGTPQPTPGSANPTPNAGEAAPENSSNGSTAPAPESAQPAPIAP